MLAYSFFFVEAITGIRIPKNTPAPALLVVGCAGSCEGGVPDSDDDDGDDDLSESTVVGLERLGFCCNGLPGVYPTATHSLIPSSQRQPFRCFFSSSVLLLDEAEVGGTNEPENDGGCGLGGGTGVRSFNPKTRCSIF